MPLNAGCHLLMIQFFVLENHDCGDCALGDVDKSNSTTQHPNRTSTDTPDTAMQDLADARKSSPAVTSSRNAIDALSALLGKVPGLGPRSARRMVLFLLRNPDSLLAPIIAQLNNIRAEVKKCACGNLDQQSPCVICSDKTRDHSVVCVVEDVTSLWAIERAKCFNGIYYVMDRVLSPTGGIGPEDLKVSRLQDYVGVHGVTEVVLALNPTVEGQATAHYVQEMLGSLVRCSRLRLGIPMGGELDYLDAGTIAAAIGGRG